MKKVFLGSSNEAVEKILEEVAVWTEDADCNPLVWNQCFEPGITAIEAIEEVSDEVDAAVLIFYPDDTLDKRGKVGWTVRDNVLFETGVMVGRLSRQRTAIILCDGIEHIPSDLAGVTVIPYSSTKKYTAKKKYKKWLANI